MCRKQGFRVSEIRLPCVKNDDSVCQKSRFRVSETRVSCVRNEGFVCQKCGFRVSKIKGCKGVYRIREKKQDPRLAS